MCSKHGKLIPVFLSGPKSKQILKDTQTIDELSSVIKLNLEKCRGHCKNESLIVSSFDIPKKRVARSDDEEEVIFIFLFCSGKSIFINFLFRFFLAFQ